MGIGCTRYDKDESTRGVREEIREERGEEKRKREGEKPEWEPQGVVVTEAGRQTLLGRAPQGHGKVFMLSETPATPSPYPHPAVLLWAAFAFVVLPSPVPRPPFHPHTFPTSCASGYSSPAVASPIFKRDTFHKALLFLLCTIFHTHPHVPSSLTSRLRYLFTMSKPFELSMTNTGSGNNYHGYIP